MDLASPSLAQHQQRTAFTEAETRLIEVAGNLHDLGKLAIPNSILDKPEKLTIYLLLEKNEYYITYNIIYFALGGKTHKKSFHLAFFRFTPKYR